MIHDISDALGRARQLLPRPLDEVRSYLAPLAAILRDNARDPAVMGDQARQALQLAQDLEAKLNGGAVAPPLR